MKKVIVLSILLMLGMNMFAQEILYKPVVIDDCDQFFVNWIFYDNDSIYPLNSRISDIDTIKLPRLGEYYLKIDDYVFNINIDSYGLTTDTFNIPKLTYGHMISFTPVSYYSYCNEKADGYIVDNYYNGNIRFKGSFIDGQLIDTLWGYYDTGELMLIKIDNDNEYTKTIFYRNGLTKSFKDYNSGYEIGYFKSGNFHYDKKQKQSRPYLKKSTRYYSASESVSKYYKHKDLFYKNVQLYENGNIKEKRNYYSLVQYYEDTKIKAKVNRSIKIYDNLFISWYNTSYQYNCILYDTNGNKTAKIVYVGEDYYFDYFLTETIDDTPSVDFEKLIIYKDGEVIKKYNLKNRYDDNKDYVYYDEERNAKGLLSGSAYAAYRVSKALSEYLDFEIR